jgi:hypothetical protein
MAAFFIAAVLFAMKLSFFLFLVIVIAGCDSPLGKDAAEVQPENHLQPHAIDSLISKREQDRFYAIRPARKFAGKDNNESFAQMIAAMIDTTHVIRAAEKFTAEWLHDYGKDSTMINQRAIFTNESYEIKVTTSDKERIRRIFINGRELIPGKNLDVSLADEWWNISLEVSPDEFKTIKIGGKAYLLIKGDVYMSTGGRIYYLLYDRSIHSGILIEQSNTDFIAGYDKKIQSPVFVRTERARYESSLKAFMLEGRCYRLDASGKVKKYTDLKGKQYYYNGYGTGRDDTLRVIDGHFAR